MEAGHQSRLRAHPEGERSPRTAKPPTKKAGIPSLKAGADVNIANGSHSAIYLGNGLVQNALNPTLGTQVTGLNVFQGGYSIRRIL